MWTLLFLAIAPSQAATMDRYEGCYGSLAPEVEVACECYKISRFEWWNGTNATHEALGWVWDAPDFAPSSGSKLADLTGTCFDLGPYVNPIVDASTRKTLGKILVSKGVAVVEENEPGWKGFSVSWGWVRYPMGWKYNVVSSLLSMDEDTSTGDPNGLLHPIGVWPPDTFEVRNEENEVLATFSTEGQTQPLEVYLIDVGEESPKLVAKMANDETWMVSVDDPFVVHTPPLPQ